MLKNIRLGNVSIHVNRIDELKKQLTETEVMLKRATKKLGIYELRVGDKIYRGRSHNPEKRIRQHLSRSSNPSIREAVRSGERVQASILGTFDVITKADADHIERQFIQAIPREASLNRVLPVANDNEVVIRNEMIIPPV